MPILFSWLHLSDFHFLPCSPAPSFARAQADQSFAIKQLRDDVVRIIGVDEVQLNAVLLTGDVAQSGGEAEYVEARAWLQSLCQQLRVDLSSVFCVPGNHDVVRCPREDRDGQRLLSALREGQEHLEECLADTGDSARLLNRMRTYLQFVRQLGSPSGSTGSFNCTLSAADGGLRLRLVGLNTSLLADGDDQKKLQVGQRALASLLWEQDDDVPEVVLALTHHPLSWLRDEQEVERWISSQGVHVHLSGHTHDQQQDLICKGTGKRVIRISTGPGHVAPEKRRKLAYNIASLMMKQDGSLALRIRPRVLHDGAPEFRPDSEHLPDDAIDVTYPLGMKLPRSKGARAAVPQQRPKTTAPTRPQPAMPQAPRGVEYVETSASLCPRGPADLCSSFDPGAGVFRRVLLSTTPGFDQESPQADPQHDRSIFLVRDPLRPFETQFGASRRDRPGGRRGIVPSVHGITLTAYRLMYPAIVGPEYEWLRTVIAELATDPEVLDFIHANDPTKAIRDLAAKNPMGSRELKQSACLFCKESFLGPRIVAGNLNQSDAYIINNDFPYGAHFHYVVMPREAAHSWEGVEERHLCAMNRLIHDFLVKGRDRPPINSAAGVRIGFNSSLRHLVLGRKTRSSAGATILHVHKQIWGMAASGYNLADHMVRLCEQYPDHDYLDRYLEFLRRAGFVLDEDEHLALVVPLCQISLHELHIMFKRRGVCTFLDLTESELASLSKAELMVTRLYAKMDIASFNELFLFDRFRSESERKRSRFRAVATFITREVDLAVSELSLAYVVDKLPEQTVEEAQRHLSSLGVRLSGG